MNLKALHYRAIQGLSVGAGMLILVAYGGWLFSRPIESFASDGLPGVTPPAYARSFSINHGHAMYYRDGVPSEHPYKANLIYGGLASVVLPFLWADSRIRRLREQNSTPVSVSPSAEFLRGLWQAQLVAILFVAGVLIIIWLFKRAA